MAQYLLSVWHDEDYDLDFSTEEAQRIGAKVGALNEELDRAGAMAFAGGLHPASSATVLRADAAGDVSMTDGPALVDFGSRSGSRQADRPDSPMSQIGMRCPSHSWRSLGQPSALRCGASTGR